MARRAPSILVELEAATRALEEELDQLRHAARGATTSQTDGAGGELTAGLSRARQALDDGCEVLAAASPAGTAVFDQVTVQRSALRELVERTGHRSDPLASLVARLTAVPFGVAAAGVVESAPAWALGEGKTVKLQVGPRELMLPSELARVLPGVLAHLVRNAIAHGIESPEDRKAAGKPVEGAIRIAATEEGAPDIAGEATPWLVITVHDDGRGLDVARILGRAEDSADPAEVVFRPGMTTREETDALAGRGVGLDAVRHDLSRIHYDVSVSFFPGQWTRFTIAPARAH